MILKALASRKTKSIIFSFWDCIFPKNQSKLVLVVKNRTEFSGNLRVAADLLLSENKHQIYAYKDGKFVPEIKAILQSKGIIVLEGWSLKSLYHLLTSGIFIFSHAPRDAHITKKCQKRMIINLWHGVAFKSIENLMPDIPHTKQKQIANNAKLYDLVIASSKADQQTNMKAFMLDESKVKITGLPRYELLKDTYPLDSFLQTQKKQLLTYKKNKTLILYAPTFREKNISALNQMTNHDWDTIGSLLARHNAIMAIRPHPYDTALPVCLEGNENFCWLDHEEFTETNLILQFTDILIVDFSSIWIDYLLLNRPIIGFAKDFEHYLHSERGFAYNFEQKFPDSFHNTTISLVQHLEGLLALKNLTQEYQAITSFFHAYALETNFTEVLKDVLRLPN